MAFLRPSLSFVFLFLTITSLVLQPSPVNSLKCTSEKFTNAKTFAKCTDLPTLRSTLHYTFTPENSSLSIAFIAPPATPNGWIAWAINPTQTGMIGSQSLVAFKNSHGTMIVKTYNITSYEGIEEGKIAFEVPESSAEFSGGVMKIFATVKLPETMTKLNHVWQVGPSVMKGIPMKHAFLPENLNAKGTLELVGKGKSTTSGGPTPSSLAADSPTPTVAPSTSSASSNVGIYGIMVFLGCLLRFF